MNDQEIRRIAISSLPSISILLDCRCLAREFRGISQYTYHLAIALLRLRYTTIAILAFEKQILPFKCKCNMYYVADKCIRSSRGTHMKIGEAIADMSPDVFLTTSWFDTKLDFDSSYFYLTHVIVHDLTPLYHFKVASEYLNRISQLKFCKSVYSVSEYTKSCFFTQEIHSHCIGVGTNRPLARHDETIALVKVRYGIKRKYLFCQSAYDVHKGIEFLISEYSALPGCVRDEFQLVLGMDLPFPVGCHDIVSTGRLSEGDKYALHHGAYAFVFPSRAEGFGMTVAEALSVGTPAIVGNNSALVELVKDKRFRFDSTVGMLTALLMQLCSNAEFYESCRNYALEHRRHLKNWNDVTHILLEHVMSDKLRDS
jgi:glycosyltransferase involved in cell wall biosynthesis